MPLKGKHVLYAHTFIAYIHTVLAKKSSRFYIVLQYKNVNFFWPVLYMHMSFIDIWNRTPTYTHILLCPQLVKAQSGFTEVLVCCMLVMSI